MTAREKALIALCDEGEVPKPREAYYVFDWLYSKGYIERDGDDWLITPAAFAARHALEAP